MKNIEEPADTDADHPLKKKTIMVNRDEWEAEQRTKREERRIPRNLKREDQQISQELRAARKGERKYPRMVTRGRKFTQRPRKRNGSSPTPTPLRQTPRALEKTDEKLRKPDPVAS